MSPVDNAVKAAQGLLVDAAVQLAAGDLFDEQLRQALFRAADTYARAVWASKTGKGGTKTSTGRGRRSGVVCPFGREKGVPIEEAKTDNLRWLVEALSNSIDDPQKARWRADNIKTLNAIEAELRTR